MPALEQFIQGAASIGGGIILAIWLYLMITDRLVTSKRVDEANARTEKAEKARDEALAIARDQVEATKRLADLQEQGLDFLRSTLSKRSGS